MSEKFTEIDTAALKVRDVGNRLVTLGRAARTLGLGELAETLFWEATELEAHCKTIRDANNGIVGDRYRDATESSAALLAGVLAGVSIGRTKETADARD